MVPVRRCPKCYGNGIKEHDTVVTDSRERPDGIWRRRYCPYCHHKFSTLEIPIESAHEVTGLDRKAKSLIKAIENKVRKEIEAEKESDNEE